MLDNDNGKRPQRRSALIALELGKLAIDIAAVSEVRFPNNGSLVEHEAGYTLFWSGEEKNERKVSGVGFMITNPIARKMSDLPKCHSDRLMSVRIPIRNNNHITLISAYAPNLQDDPNNILNFYTKLSDITSEIPAKDKIIILGDFNARVGNDKNIWHGVLGAHGLSPHNENGN